MPGGVIHVQRKGRFAFIERIYLPALMRGLWVSGRHFFRNLRGFVTGRNRRDFVVQYPEERLRYPDAFRGMPVLVAHDDGRPRCVACGLCEFACPPRCIEIRSGELPDDAIERYPERFDIDMARCMFCGLCEEVCPEEAIVMSPLVEVASYDRESMRFDLKALLVPPAAVQARLDFLRRGYEAPVDSSDARARAPGAADESGEGGVGHMGAAE